MKRYFYLDLAMYFYRKYKMYSPKHCLTNQFARKNDVKVLIDTNLLNFFVMPKRAFRNAPEASW